MTPLMEQYWRIKQAHKGRLLFFRMGDFFEMFGGDAEKAAPILNIALTCRNKKAREQIKMCGLPHHSISGPIAKLLKAGLSVAICDQIEPADQAKGSVVKRAVTRILSPGMVYDPAAIDQSQPNYIAAFDREFASFLDSSTGRAFYYKSRGAAGAFQLMSQFSPAELILSRSQKEDIQKRLLPPPEARLTVFSPSDLPEGALSHSDLKKHEGSPESAQRLVRYALFMQGESVLSLLDAFELRSLSREMRCSQRLFERLEIFKSCGGSAKGSLFAAIDRTKTPGGARLLKRNLQTPLIDQAEIERRWDQIDKWLSQRETLSQVRKILSGLGDAERKIGVITNPICSGRSLLAAGGSLARGLELQALAGLDPYPSARRQAEQARDKIRAAIKPSCPGSLKDGGLINKGIDDERDRLEELAESGQRAILEMERRERQKTMIPSLKIRYNNIFGYYIEITKNHVSKAPAAYRRKQTLVHAERYTMDELDDLEGRILSARARQAELESRIFHKLRKELLEQLPGLLRLAYFWSEIDALSSLAFLAIEKNYVRPKFGPRLCLQGSRHPVLEQKPLHEFVPNTISLDPGEALLLTGPNMSGKSVLMRQAALSAILAQSGSFVPAERAELPVFHKIFARIGAGDSLLQGMSTFMAEMSETAEILEHADSKSLIILDEIGRGTATFDGMSLAQAILEFLIGEKKPFLLSATHYHELTRLADVYPSARNGSMAIRESKDGLRFLYTLTEGAAGKSYGISAARQAGLPKSVLDRAERLLDRHEKPAAGAETNLQREAKFEAKKKAGQSPRAPKPGAGREAEGDGQIGLFSGAV